MLKPWERQPGESAPAFEARWSYLQMGPNRSIDAVVRKWNKSRSLIGKWSGRWRWVEAARAYDDDRAALAARIDASRFAEEVKAELERLHRREKELAEMLHAMLTVSYNNLVIVIREAEAAERLVDPEEWDRRTRTFARLAPLVMLSLDRTEARLNLRATGRGAGAPSQPISGAARAALRAFADVEAGGEKA
jgi:hypothetical protein